MEKSPPFPELVSFLERLAEPHIHGLIGRAPAFLRMLELVARVAPSEASVLLQGESGTGKELVAAAVHAASRRADRPFVVVDCSGLPETLFESEVFGHERGAFTGATARKAGLVEAASGGTLFLDEIGDIPLGIQVKLLRLLETGTFRRLGSTELRRADVRLVSATHRRLQDRVREGMFRQDLYFRINTFPITVPALRDRVGDLPLLGEALLARVAPTRRLGLSAAAWQALARYDFPGNVRELRNVLERASLMCDGDVIGVEHLAIECAAGRSGRASDADTEASRRGLQGSERGLLDQARLLGVVEGHRGSRRDLARKLGLSERTLYRRLRSLGVGKSGCEH